MLVVLRLNGTCGDVNTGTRTCVSSPERHTLCHSSEYVPGGLVDGMNSVRDNRHRDDHYIYHHCSVRNGIPGSEKYIRFFSMDFDASAVFCRVTRDEKVTYDTYTLLVSSL